MSLAAGIIADLPFEQGWDGILGLARRENQWLISISPLSAAASTATGIARDAAGRGFRVVLIEQNDLASGTSSASSKLIHGGLRYLEQRQFRLVRAALREREVLLRAAPHLIRPLRFVLPINEARRSATLLRLGLLHLRLDRLAQDFAGHARARSGDRRSRPAAQTRASITPSNIPIALPTTRASSCSTRSMPPSAAR